VRSSAELLAAVRPSGERLGSASGHRFPAVTLTAERWSSLAAARSSGADAVAALLAARLERRPARVAAPGAEVADQVFAVIGGELLPG
jgi:hypothetical protein